MLLKLAKAFTHTHPRIEYTVRNVIRWEWITARCAGLRADPTEMIGSSIWKIQITTSSHHKPDAINISSSNPLPTMNPRRKAARQFLTNPKSNLAGFDDSSVKELDIWPFYPPFDVTIICIFTPFRSSFASKCELPRNIFWGIDDSATMNLLIYQCCSRRFFDGVVLEHENTLSNSNRSPSEKTK